MANINLNASLCGELRNKVNEYSYFSITRTHSIKQDCSNRGWEKLCAIMDRIEDSTIYLNSLDIKYTGNRLCIFEFYNFMNVAASLLDCIKFLAEIYDFDLSVADNKTDVFKKYGRTGKGTDKKYFEYLRSLCSVHPIETSRHSEFQDEETEVECSPFVIWNNKLYDRQYDLVAIVYTSKSEFFQKEIGIKVFEIFEYITYRYDMLKEIINHIDSYYQKIIANFRTITLKTQTDFSNYLDYIDYLKSVYSERINSGWDEYFNFCKNVILCTFNDKQNQERLIKFQNAIKYGLTFLHKYLQELPNEDKYETTGLHRQPAHTTGDSLFLQLQEVPYSEELRQYDYAFEKLSLLMFYPHSMQYSLIDDSNPFWGKYVSINKQMSNTEICVLIHVAFYFWKLENDSEFSSNIPETGDYR